MARVQFGKTNLFPKKGEQQQVIGVKLIGDARGLQRKGGCAVIFLFDQAVFRQNGEHFRNTELLDAEGKCDVFGANRIAVLPPFIDDEQIPFFPEESKGRLPP